MPFSYLMGLIVFAGSLILMFLTVPGNAIKKYALFGLFSGLGIAALLLLIMQNLLGLWIYRKVDFLYIGRIPIILSAAWTPTEIFFAHFLSQYQQFWSRVLLILFIPVIAVGIHFIQIWTGILTYYHWNYFGTFLVSLGIHAGLALYLNRVYKIPFLA